MKRILVCFGAILAAVILLTVISTVIIDEQTDGLTYSEVKSVPHRKVGLLLGCPKKLAGGHDNPFFNERINAAISLFRAGKIEYLLVSGDNISKGCYETVAMKDDLIKRGMPADKIYCDYRGLRTLDSVVRAKEIFGQAEITIISQEFHNRRAIFIAGHRGINSIGFNAKDSHSFNFFSISLRELFSRVRAILDIYILRTDPKFPGNGIPADLKARLTGSCSNKP